MSNVMYLNNYNQIICWGDITSCKRYINQMYDISLEKLHLIDYSTNEYYSSQYEDYEVVNIRGTDLYLTLGEVKMMRQSCQEESQGIRFIEKELENLIKLDFSDEIINELIYMKDFMKDLYGIHAKQISNSLFDNLDLDSIRMSYQIERENKGLPVIFIY